MAKFLKTTGVSHYLSELINNAKEKVYLVSPYLQINDQIKLLIEDSSTQSKQISIVYGKEKDAKDLAWLSSIRGLGIYFYDTLHAKCYMNEKEAVITSMNLYMYSQQNNCEMGIYLTKKDDPEMYNEVLTEVERILRQSKEVSKPTLYKKVETNKPFKKAEQHYGYCIRTGVQINLNPEQPMCYKAFNSWAQFSDGDYPEKFCHYSGDKSDGQTSYNRPILKKYWNEAKKKFDI